MCLNTNKKLKASEKKNTSKRNKDTGIDRSAYAYNYVDTKEIKCLTTEPL